ncbi:MAG: sulfotransferase [Gemmatimonadaceae bacterium]|nr:sulfotransferase [Gemmatimonadaceae bacterium]
MTIAPSGTRSAGRSQAPVFVVGCPRSGTTLLYHMLLSAGRFAQYRAETHIYCSLAPRFGGLRTEKDVEQALEVWLASDCHRLTGLGADVVRGVVRQQTRNAGDFLRLIMDQMVQQQGAQRWAETTPAHVLHLREIHAHIPDALFLHVIRDGRDVATSLERQSWIRPFSADRSRPVLAAAAYWDWLVRRGRAEGAAVGAAYREVRYEQLISDPEATLRSIESFIDHRLDWHEIQRAGIGSVGRPNSSFPEAQGGFQSRWRTQLSSVDADAVSQMLAPTLRALGYPDIAGAAAPSIALRRIAYGARFGVRDRLKRFTPVGRRVTDLSHYTPGTMVINEEKMTGVFGPAASPGVKIDR